MSNSADDRMRQLVAAWDATAAVVAEWAERTSAVTVEQFHKLTSDPAVRAVLDGWRSRRSGFGATAPAGALSRTRTT